jgi:ATP-dependent Clp protease adaptor protein ClpS
MIQGLSFGFATFGQLPTTARAGNGAASTGGHFSGPPPDAEAAPGLDTRGVSTKTACSPMAQAPDKREQGDTELLDRTTTKQPRRFHVVLHNDDYTTMEFVVFVLIRFFSKSETEATQIMLQVHHRGYGVVGLFTRDVAETKAQMVMDFAKANGHPLKCTAEPEGTGRGSAS